MDISLEIVRAQCKLDLVASEKNIFDWSCEMYKKLEDAQDEDEMLKIASLVKTVSIVVDRMKDFPDHLFDD